MKVSSGMCDRVVPPSDLTHVGQPTENQRVMQVFNVGSHILLYMYRMSVQSGLSIGTVADFIYRLKVRGVVEGPER